MFDSTEYPKPLEESIFEYWLEEGRLSNLGYHYLLIVWDAYDEKYLPTYLTLKSEIEKYDKYGEAMGRESVIAAYDLFSESRISLQ